MNLNTQSKKIITERSLDQGVDINNSTSILLEELHLEAEERIRIEGTGGGSTAAERQDTFLDGVMIVDSTLKVNQRYSNLFTQSTSLLQSSNLLDIISTPLVVTSSRNLPKATPKISRVF